MAAEKVTVKTEVTDAARDNRQSTTVKIMKKGI